MFSLWETKDLIKIKGKRKKRKKDMHVSAARIALNHPRICLLCAKANFIRREKVILMLH
jgi:hypothetical protein